MRLILVGECAAKVIAGHHTGRVLAVFRRAVYLSFPGGALALVDGLAEPGPLHAHVDTLAALAVGDRVRADHGSLSVAGAHTAAAPDIWRAPPLPTPAKLITAAATLRKLVDHTPDLDLAGGAGPATAEVLSATLRRRGLEAAAAELVGRGPGLTPAGDDILAGLLLVARSAAGTHGRERLLRIAGEAATNEISRAYLVSAARGGSLAAVHELMDAGAAGDVTRARTARARLARIGHTSGLDLAYGVLVGSSTLATAPWPDRRGW